MRGRTATILAVAALAAATFLAAACSRGAGAEDDGTAAAHYTVRGQVSQLPEAGHPGSNLVIRHEAIDDFVSSDGERVGMGSMAMPFPVADDVSLAGIEPGDKVRFTLVVDWDGDPAYQVTDLEKLPADTELVYGKAHPPATAPEPDSNEVSPSSDSD